MKSVDLRITGQVQGVGFRMNTVTEALRLGVAGWVRNEPDESVAAHVEGDDDAVDALVAWCRQGPMFASVSDVQVTEVGPSGATSFELRY